MIQTIAVLALILAVVANADITRMKMRKEDDGTFVRRRINRAAQFPHRRASLSAQDGSIVVNDYENSQVRYTYNTPTINTPSTLPTLYSFTCYLLLAAYSCVCLA
jgi:hypothetical protein